MIARSTRAEFWLLLLLLQKYRLAVSRGLVTTPPGEGSNDRWSSSSESQPDEHDEDAAAEWRGAFAASGTEEAPCDPPRSMARMQREVQRKLQEQIEVNDRSIAIPSS